MVDITETIPDEGADAIELETGDPEAPPETPAPVIEDDDGDDDEGDDDDEGGEA